MNYLKEIRKNKIKKLVIFEIKKAKKEILTTMDITEEIKSPLSPSYFSLLGRKHKEGIKIRRLVFGPLKHYRYFLKQTREKKLFFTGMHTDSKNYKRMVMIDQSKLFFRNKRKFYFTNNQKYIEKYKMYFNKF